MREKNRRRKKEERENCQDVGAMAYIVGESLGNG
jgi:hypothetical protein